MKLLRAAMLCGLLATPAWSQSWSGILNPSRAIDWSTAGIPGGIPSASWKQAGSTIAAAQSPCLNGAGDCTATIQTALNACGKQRYVLLGEGTFRLDGTLVIPGDCALRGSGASKTILNAKGRVQNAVIAMGAGSTNPQRQSAYNPNFASAVHITSGATRGSRSIVVSSTAGIAAGGYLVIDQINDGVIVTNVGNEGACTWCDTAEAQGTRAQGQLVQVTSVHGATLGIEPELFTDYKRTPLATPLKMISYAGLENLQIYANNTGYAASVYMADCAYCWVSGIEDNYADGDHIDTDFAYHGEIINSYFSNAYQHMGGLFDADLAIRSKSTGMLVENNIFERLHVGVMLVWGSAGNVVAYNYFNSNFDPRAPGALQMSIDFHGAHPQYNLIEGNVLENMGEDSVHGSYGNTTYFRNWVRGAALVCNPLTGRAPVICAPLGIYGKPGVNSWTTSQAVRAVEIQYLTSNVNLVGNVVGSSLMKKLTYLYGSHQPLSQSNSVVAPAYRDYDLVAYGYSFGFHAANDNGKNGQQESQAPFKTLFWHGDYSDITKSTVWAPGVTHSLPASFYLSSRPSWWSAAIPWPAIGPEVSGGAGGSGHAGTIPAEACYQKVMGGSLGAAGSPYPFDAALCYSTDAPEER
jgi:hypothetical protein